MSIAGQASNRRQILLGLAAAATTAATPAAGKTAISAENPELLKLAGDLPRLHAEYIDAHGAERRIFREAMANWPRAPKEIRSLLGGKLEMDVRNVGITWPDCTRMARLGTPDCFRDEIRRGKREVERIVATFNSPIRRDNAVAFETRKIAEAEIAIPLAERYWAECDSIKSTSGYEAATALLTAARTALCARVDAIMRAPETSLMGVVIKAQALEAWSEVGPLFRALSPGADKWGGMIAASIMRQATNDPRR